MHLPFYRVVDRRGAFVTKGGEVNCPDSPLVSVCVATYNQDRYIEDCLISVLAQLADIPIEILVGDDGNSPATPLVVARLSERYPGVIRYFKHERNLGASANYQFLVGRAMGQFIAHLDGDDYWLPGKLRAQVAWLDAHPGSPACYANAVVIDDGGVLVGGFSSAIANDIDSSFLLERGNFLNHSSMLYRANHKNVVLGIDGPFIDYRLHLGFAREGGLGFDNRALVVYRLGSEHSMVKTVPETVRELYFEAVCSATLDPSISDRVRRRAVAHFLTAVILDSIVHLRWRSTLSWFGRIRVKFPHDHRRALLGGVYGAMGWLWRALSRRMGIQSSSAGSLRVLYER